MTNSPTPNRGIVVFSGGSAANSLVDVFSTVRENKACPLSYVIPISDNGGSSSELIRIFGGPGIGDVRSKFQYTQNAKSSIANASLQADLFVSFRSRPLDLSVLPSSVYLTIDCSLLAAMRALNGMALSTGRLPFGTVSLPQRRN